MIRPLAFCAGLALAWCGAAEADPLPDIVIGGQVCKIPEGKTLCLPSLNFECGPGFWTDTKAACDEVKRSTPISRPEDALRLDLDDLKERVTQLEQEMDNAIAAIHVINGTNAQLVAILKAVSLPDCGGEPPERLPCIEREDK